MTPLLFALYLVIVLLHVLTAIYLTARYYIKQLEHLEDNNNFEVIYAANNAYRQGWMEAHENKQKAMSKTTVDMDLTAILFLN